MLPGQDRLRELQSRQGASLRCLRREHIAARFGCSTQRSLLRRAPVGLSACVSVLGPILSQGTHFARLSVDMPAFDPIARKSRSIRPRMCRDLTCAGAAEIRHDVGRPWFGEGGRVPTRRTSLAFLRLATQLLHVNRMLETARLKSTRYHHTALTRCWDPRPAAYRPCCAGVPKLPASIDGRFGAKASRSLNRSVRASRQALIFAGWPWTPLDG